jgi:hypothetical protein
MEPVEDTKEAVLNALADGGAAGAVDAPKVDAAIAKLESTGASLHECVAGPLNQLHATLAPLERRELADKVIAHWTVWKRVNHEAEAGGREEGGRLAVLAKDLGLKPEQLEKLSPALHTAISGHAAKLEPAPIHDAVNAFAKAFVADAFDAKAVASKTTATLASHSAKRMELFYETVTPVLTAEQRTTLAGHLREHAKHHPDE